MSRPFLSTVTAGLLIMLYHAIAEGRAEPPAVWTEANGCGASALYSLLRLEGFRADPNALASRLPPPPPQGHSMKDIREAAATFGLRMAGVRLRDYPAAVDRPMLVYLDRGAHGHFVVVRPVGHTGKLVQVIDASRPPEILDQAYLFSSPGWTGLALAPDRLGPWRLLALGLGIGFLLLLAVGMGLRALPLRRPISRG